MRPSRVIMSCAAIALAVAAIVWGVPRSIFFSALVEHFLPGVIPARSYARNLESSDPDLVRESLAHLRGRKNPVAVPQAIPLLSSTDAYIWLNAAQYLGGCGHQASVPYLIKALRHTAWRADAENVRLLEALTGQSFGSDFMQWQKWWLLQRPPMTLDWSSHLGPYPRTTQASAN